jgi:hypothetical protein
MAKLVYNMDVSQQEMIEQKKFTLPFLDDEVPAFCIADGKLIIRYA